MGEQFDDPNREAVGLQPITTAEATKSKSSKKDEPDKKATKKADDEE